MHVLFDLDAPETVKCVPARYAIDSLQSAVSTSLARQSLLSSLSYSHVPRIFSSVLLLDVELLTLR